MPMVPEAVIAMLACARIGAVHRSLFNDRTFFIFFLFLIFSLSLSLLFLCSSFFLVFLTFKRTSVSVVFGGFASDQLAARINHAKPKVFHFTLHTFFPTHIHFVKYFGVC
jgi:hypothetical protein